MQESKPEYFNIALSTSLAVFGFFDNQLFVLLGKKRHEPFLGMPILPTNWVSPENDVMEVAKKLLIEALGEQNYYLEQLNAFANVDRKPEGRVVNIAHYSLVYESMLSKTPKDNFTWVPVSEIPTLAYDHNIILSFAQERLKRRVKHRPIGFHLLTKEFTIKNIHSLYQQSLGKELDKRNFTKKLMKSNLLIDLGKTITEADSFKPSNLYAFDKEKYDSLSLKGYDFKF